VVNAKRKGDTFERDVVGFFRDTGWPACSRRGSQWWTKDRYAPDIGDIVDGPEGWALQCKNHQSIDLASYLDDAAQQARNARKPWFAAIVKRRRRHVSEAYVVMPLAVFAEVAAIVDQHFYEAV
jgi:hypothetical protein